MRWEIKWKLTTLIFVLTFLPIIVVIIVSSQYISSRSLELIKEKEVVVGRTIEHAVKNYIDLGFKIDELIGINNQLILSTVEYKEISSIYITDNDGKIIYHSDPSLIGVITNLPQIDDRAKLFDVNVFTNVVTFNNQTFYQTILPIVSENKVLAKIRIDVPEEVVVSNERMLTSTYIFLILIVSGGLLTAILLSVKRIVQPIIKLGEVANKMAKRDFSVKAEVLSDDEIGDLSKSFNYMAEEIGNNHRDLEQNVKNLKKLLEIKTDFLHTVNHQLRTPLTVLAGYIDLWNRKEYADLPIERREEIKKNITLAANQLTLIIDKIMEAVDVEGGNIRLLIEEVNLTELAKRLVEDGFERSAKEKNLKFTQKIKPNVVIFSDRKYLTSIITTLLDNAIDYTEKGFVDLSIDKIGKEVEIKIEDSGIGLSNADKNNLYEKFSRGEEATKIDPTGNGISLYIVKQMVSELNGTIEAFSPGRNKGTTFIIKIPETYETHKIITSGR